MKKRFIKFWKDENGIGIVELILILVILIMIIAIFRTEITGIITTAFQQIDGKAGAINSSINLKKK